MGNVANVIVEKKLSIALWGAGRNCKLYLKRIEKFCQIEFIIDINQFLKGTYVGKYLCKSPDSLKNVDAVVIMIDDRKANNEIRDFCGEKEIAACNYRELLSVVNPIYEESLIKNTLYDVNPGERSVMRKYIGMDVPVYGCNLDCPYCYLGQKYSNETAFPELIHSPRYIRYRLRREIIGGSALIGICGCGETLFADKLTEICTELLKEGHYLIIVTNGIATEALQDIIKNAGEYAGHVIFKISFHYIELKRRNLLEHFADNIKYINNSKSSYTLELMPHDELIKHIPDILSFSLNNFGAYPQLTVGREEKNNKKILTKLSKEEYIQIWKVFQSEMFNLKMKFYLMHGMNCNAGKDSFSVELHTGNISRCIFPENKWNFYDEDFLFEFERVGDACPLDYCYNCHAYVTLGVMPDIIAPTYLDIRDRIKEDGSHWIKEEMRSFLNSKFYELHNMTNEE